MMFGAARRGEFDEAFAATCERDDGHWLGKRRVDLLKKALASRNHTTLCQQAVRLAALMHVADPCGYEHFLYVAIPNLQAESFRRALLAAAPRLARMAELEEAGLRFCPEAFSLQGKPYDLRFRQMPMAAGYLDFLKNALGTDAEDALAPVLAADPAPGTADAVSRRLRSLIEAWLSERLSSEHITRKIKPIQAHLTLAATTSALFFREASGEMVRFTGPVGEEPARPVQEADRARWTATYSAFVRTGIAVATPAPAPGELRASDLADQVNDAEILEFWASVTKDSSPLWRLVDRWRDISRSNSGEESHENPEHEPDETPETVTGDERNDAARGARTSTRAEKLGFKEFRSCARAMIAYRYHLVEAMSRLGTGQLADVRPEPGDDFDFLERMTADDAALDSWSSPLIPCLSVGDHVNWLPITQRILLSFLLDCGSRGGEDDGREGRGDDDGRISRRNALFGDLRPDPRFFLTFFRYVAFGDLQRAAATASQKKTQGILRNSMPRQGMGTSFGEIAGALAQRETMLTHLVYAIARILLNENPRAGILVLGNVDPEIGRLLRDSAEEHDLDLDAEDAFEALENLLRARVEAYLSSPAGATVAARLASGLAKSERKGLRLKDVRDDAALADLEILADHVPSIISELRRVRDFCMRRDPESLWKRDREFLAAMLERLYGYQVPAVSDEQDSARQC